MHQSDIRGSGSITLRNSLQISIALSFISLLAQSACRLLQPQGVHPVPAPAGLHHLQHVAGDDDDDDDDDNNNDDDAADGGGAGDPGHCGPHQPRQPGLPALLA